jgi:cellulose biosynthesis protein BcsQ
LLIVSANNKGGSGKTTALRLIAYQLASYPEYSGRLLAADFDLEQLNFSDYINDLNDYPAQTWENYIGSPYVPPPIQVLDIKKVNIKTYANSEKEICLCDTPPAVVSNDLDQMISIADIVIVPVRGNKDDVQGAARIINLRDKNKLNKTKAFINEYTGIPREEQAETYLRSLGVEVLTFPRSELMVTNFNVRRPWWIGSRVKFRQTVDDFINNLLSV